ncbi:uncharacterized protein LOC131431529 [Malaya genurostris]|uniref:uncharacterized protein LOC131431529 n=1 Tax=Malaya genurostris TaxID=325434 RepID=UPI0026F3998F|nr:uncharacterized protein LOC131431529 [Malaya genurostris]
MDAAATRSADLEKRRICRFCLQSSEQLRTIDGTDGEELTLKIATSLALEVSPGDGLPQTLCERCLWLLEKFNLFKNQCSRAEFLLKSFALTGIPLMHALEPFEIGCFCSRQKQHPVDAAVQVSPPEPEPEPEVFVARETKSEIDSEDEVIFVGDIKEEVEVDEDWHYDADTLDAVTEQLYEEEPVSIIQSSPFSDVEQIFGARIKIDGSIDIDEAKLEQVISTSASKISNTGKENVDASCDEHSSDGSPVEMDEKKHLNDDSHSNSIKNSLSEGSLDNLEVMIMDLTSEDTFPTESKSINFLTKVSPPDSEIVDLTLDVEAPTAPLNVSNTSFSDAMQSLLEDEKLYESKKSNSYRRLTNQDSLQSSLNTLYGDIPTTPLGESDGLDSRFLDREDGEIISDDELEPLALSSELAQVRLSTPDQPAPACLRAPSPNSDEEFPCETCDKFFPQAYLLEHHKKAYHSNSPLRAANPPPRSEPPVEQSTHKVTLSINSSKQECPNCGQMIAKANYWTHIKSHGSNEKQLISFS